jgi:phospholipid/cholesterol/gamma-HCH transport system substrate-binding protein
METRANFLLMGLYAGAVLLAAVQFAFFIISPGSTAQRTTYELVVAGPAGDLSHGSSVLFNGLNVGEVTQISLSQEEPGQVLVLIEVDKSTPVRTNTKARVQLTNLTGSAVIALEGAAAPAPEIRALPGKRYPRLYIQASATADLVANIQLFPARLSQTMEKAQSALAGTPPALSAIQWNLENFTNALGLTPGGVLTPPAPDAQTLDAKSASKSLSALTTRLDKLIGAVDAAGRSRQLNDIAATSAKLNEKSSSELRRLDQLATDAQKRVKALESAIRDLGLSPKTPTPPSAPQTTGGAPR